MSANLVCCWRLSLRCKCICKFAVVFCRLPAVFITINVRVQIFADSIWCEVVNRVLVTLSNRIWFSMGLQPPATQSSYLNSSQLPDSYAFSKGSETKFFLLQKYVATRRLAGSGTLQRTQTTRSQLWTSKIKMFDAIFIYFSPYSSQLFTYLHSLICETRCDDTK